VRKRSYVIEEGRRAFSLIEILVAIALLSLLVVVLSQIVTVVSRAWVEGEKRVEVYQNGRAILDLIERDLTGAANSTRLQFVQNPPDLPSSARRAVSSCSLFWQAPLEFGTPGNLCEVGYYLVRDEAEDLYQLRRLFIPSDDSRGYFRIFDQPPTADPDHRSVPWLDTLEPAAFELPDGSFGSGANQSVVTVVSDGVVAFWLRCLDANGDPIPWLSSDRLRYNSAARFRPAIAGLANSFRWTGPDTAQTFELPSAVEVTLILIDSRTLARDPDIPGMEEFSQPSSPTGVPEAIEMFYNALTANGITGAQVFTTRINLVNAPR
jgi:prepilin-type N-terminal cleavage/methylation domain-containing protein